MKIFENLKSHFKMFFEKENPKTEMRSCTQNILKIVEEYERIRPKDPWDKVTYKKMQFIANLILDAKMTNLHVNDALEFLIPDRKTREHMISMMEKK